MKKLMLSVLVSSLALACGTPPAQAPDPQPEKVTVTANIPWTFPDITVSRCHAQSDVADCYERVGQLCQPRGAVVEEVDAHDIVFICRPPRIHATQQQE